MTVTNMSFYTFSLILSLGIFLYCTGWFFGEKVGKLKGEGKWMTYYIKKATGYKKRCDNLVEHYKNKLDEDGETWKI